MTLFVSRRFAAPFGLVVTHLPPFYCALECSLCFVLTVFLEILPTKVHQLPYYLGGDPWEDPGQPISSSFCYKRVHSTQMLAHSAALKERWIKSQLNVWIHSSWIRRFQLWTWWQIGRFLLFIVCKTFWNILKYIRLTEDIFAPHIELLNHCS